MKKIKYALSNGPVSDANRVSFYAEVTGPDKVPARERGVAA